MTCSSSGAATQAWRRCVALYVSDHGKPMDASKLSGKKLTVLQGTQTSEAPLQTGRGPGAWKLLGLSLAPRPRWWPP